MSINWNFFFQFIWLKFNQLLSLQFHKMVELNGISEFVKYNSLPYESWREWVTLGWCNTWVRGKEETPTEASRVLVQTYHHKGYIPLVLRC